MARLMKHSGVEWIGDIPADWKVGRVSYFFDIQLGKMLQPEANNANDTLENYLCAVNLGGNKLKLDTLRQMWFSPSDKKKFDVRKGDLLVVEGGDVASCDIVNEDIQDVYIQNALHRVRSSAGFDVRLLRYLLIVAKAQGYIDLICNKATISHFTKEKFSAIPYPIPPLDEQQRIAAFLDDKCARIDSVIEKTRASVEEYKKLKQAIITRAVTKGIRPNRTLKQSGIEWLGEIPSDWEVGRLKNLFILQRGYDLPSEKFVEGDFPIYGSGGLMGYHNQKTSTAPNVLIGRSGSTGKLHYIEKDFWAHNTGIFISDKKGNFCKYLYYLLNVVDMGELSTKTAVPTLDRKKIQEYKFPYTTDIEEQKEIAQYLDEKTAAIDSLVAKKNQLVTELESLKKSLIFEYVTGKKEVGK